LNQLNKGFYWFFHFSHRFVVVVAYQLY
jgi:hypothetical protein